MRISTLFSALIFTLASPAFARPQPKAPWGHRPRNYRPERRQAATCPSGANFAITAPQKNIFIGLTDVEAADVTSFLHAQTPLNLTAATNATAYAAIPSFPNLQTADAYLAAGTMSSCLWTSYNQTSRMRWLTWIPVRQRQPDTPELPYSLVPLSSRTYRSTRLALCRLPMEQLRITN